MKPVLIVIDMQEDYLARPPISERREALSDRVANLLQAFRGKKLPVIHVITLYKQDRSNWTLSMKRDNWPVVIEGTPGAEIDKKLLPLNGEPVVTKSRYSAFFETDFEKLLKACGADELVCVGINTHACVRSTVIDAIMRDWQIKVISDCVDSWDPEHHRVSMEYMSRGIAEIVDSKTLIEQLGTGQS